MTSATLAKEEYPESDVVKRFLDVVSRRLFRPGHIPPDELKWLPLFLDEAYCGVSFNRPRLYPGVLGVVSYLSFRYKLAAVSDAQRARCRPEMCAVGIEDFFNLFIYFRDVSAI